MSAENHFYITTTLPYVNADPHIGFAMELVRADIIARYKKLMGFEVFFNTGTDEHGLKIYRKSQEAGIDTKEYVDKFASKFKEILPVLGISSDVNFVRTTDEKHKKAAQEFWKICEAKGDIYKKNYKIKYCVGCELEKTESELVDGRCPLHLNVDVDIIEEENYFFRFSKYQKELLDLYEKNPDFVLPQSRLNEMKAFVSRGLEDFSISRLKSKMPWGVEVPSDPDHVMYVWFDALVNYIDVIGWPDDLEKFSKWWPVTQYCGKDNTRQQSAMWQAMLISAGLPHSKQIVVNGFITSGGQKMSKSLGNVISPVDLVNEYGTDALRYFVSRELSPFEDSDFTPERFKDSFNANLANGLGNLVSRVMKMAETNLDGPVEIPENTIPDDFKKALNVYNIQEALNIVWKHISSVDQKIQETQPFKLVKENLEEAKKIISGMVIELYTIARMLNPIMPQTSDKVKALIKENKSPDKSLFARKD